ncbi:MAG: hypothetical protein CSA42_01930 [Gammaproteobacteria bacterium]|nr:MAG: hypothetical protein CSA42_01930 [Gammaproteobacteria bacterium]
MIIEPWQWFAFGVVLLIVEMFTLTFATLWFGVAAIVVAIIAWLLPLSTSVEVLLWLILSIIGVFAWFKFIKPLAVDKTKAGLGASTIIGETGIIVTKPTLQNTGTVRFSVPMAGATEWQCRTNGEEINVGDKVVVTQILGNELVVELTK